MRIIPILLVLSCFAAVDAQITSVEKRIVKAVDQRNNEAIELLKEVVNINSGTMNVDGVREVGMVFKRCVRVSN